MANYTLTIRTLSPLHIGTGNELRHRFDFIVNDKQTGRLNTDRILEDLYDPKNPNQLPGDMIKGREGNSAYFRYIIPGKPRSAKEDSRLRECVKDIHDVPYIPGSSIKGAIRTAFGTAILSKSLVPSQEIDLRGKPKFLDNELEKKLFGKDPQDDLFRALLISDAFLPENQRDPNKTMQVLNTNPISIKNTNSSVPVELECINKGLEFHASVKIDDFILEKKQFSHRDQLSKELMQIIKKHSEERLHKLQNWYKGAADTVTISKFIDQLLRFSEEKAKNTTNMALMQMAFGTGWDGMTYSDWLRSDEYFFEDLYEKHLKRKQNKGKAPAREPGTDFPTSRKVVTVGEKPSIPLGWVLLALEPKA